MANNTFTLKLKQIALFSLFLIVSINSISQEKIGPYLVWYNYKLKMAEQVKYTVKKPLIQLQRKGSFRQSKGSLNPNDYKGSYYDRGHLFPAGLSKTYEEMYYSNDMKNIVPQNPSLNRGLWSSLEKRVEKLAIDNDSVQVTINCFQLKELKGNIYVPLYFTKEIKVWNDNIIKKETYIFENKKPIYNNLFMYLVKDE